MADNLVIANNTGGAIQVTFNGVQNLVNPGNNQVHVGQALYVVQAGGADLFQGEFAGIATVNIAVNLPAAQPALVVANGTPGVLNVVGSGPIPAGGQQGFDAPGDYIVTFPGAAAIVNIDVPAMVNNIVLTVT